jgi:acyl carrier protein
MERLVQDAIARVCDIGVERLDLDANLADLGVDSLAASEVLVDLEIQLGKQLPVDALRRLDQARTVGDIATQLESEFNGRPSRNER